MAAVTAPADSSSEEEGEGQGQGQSAFVRYMRLTHGFPEEIELKKVPECPYPYPVCGPGSCFCKVCVDKKGLFRVVRGCKCEQCSIQFVKAPETFGEMAVRHFIDKMTDIVCFFER